LKCTTQHQHSRPSELSCLTGGCVGQRVKESRQPLETQYFDLYHPMAHPPHPDNAPYLHHTCSHDLHVGRCPLQPVSLLGPSHITLLPTGSGYFLGQTFTHINTPTISTPVIVHTTPYFRWGECFETFAFKLQSPVNDIEKSIQHTELGESFKSRTINISTNEVYTLHVPLQPIINQPTTLPIKTPSSSNNIRQT
jgi:hypothetical protein